MQTAARTIDQLPGPRGLPVVGNLLQLRGSRMHTILQGWAEEFGPIFAFRFFRRPVVVIADVELIHRVLRDRPEGFRRRTAIRDAMRELGIDGLFVAEGADWRRQRKLTMHALNTDHLRDFFGRLEQVTGRLQRRWERAADEGSRVDAQRDLMRFTVDVTSGLVFGYDLNTLEQRADAIQQHLGKMFPALLRRLLAPVRYWHYVKLPVDRELDAAVAEVHKLAAALIARARARLEREPGLRARPGNLLEAIIAAQDAETGAFSDREVLGNALTMLLAGEDTTANTISWVIHFLVRHPDVHARAREEVDRVLGGADRPADYTSTEALRFVEAVAHEAMRHKPVAPFLAFEPYEDVELGGVKVPAGNVVYLLTGKVANEEKNFADARAFRPERWLEGGGQTHPGHDTRAFLPFGAGARFCPGRHLAMLEIKMVIAMLCRNFEVGPVADAAAVEEVFSLTMRPENLFVSLRRRSR
ncbi:MAG: cytochrome P450 [Burkholderiales bacterium]|jgi:cytochrome P450